MPSPELDPARFESFVGLRRAPNRMATRFQSLGIMMMGLGLALACLIAFAAKQAGIGIGVGGGLAILGLAAFISGALHSGDEPAGSAKP